MHTAMASLVLSLALMIPSVCAEPIPAPSPLLQRPLANLSGAHAISAASGSSAARKLFSPQQCYDHLCDGHNTRKHPEDCEVTDGCREQLSCSKGPCLSEWCEDFYGVLHPGDHFLDHHIPGKKPERTATWPSASSKSDEPTSTSKFTSTSVVSWPVVSWPTSSTTTPTTPICKASTTTSKVTVPTPPVVRTCPSSSPSSSRSSKCPGSKPKHEQPSVAQCHVKFCAPKGSPNFYVIGTDMLHADEDTQHCNNLINCDRDPDNFQCYVKWCGDVKKNAAMSLNQAGLTMAWALAGSAAVFSLL